jgi:multidrug efflux system membrane fusion protein
LSNRVFFTVWNKPRRLARFFLAGLLLLTACSGGPSAEEPQKKEKPQVPVAVAQVLEKDVPVQLTAVGNVEAYATVSVKSRVGGELVAVHFQEGQEVKEGDPLFTIDKSPYEVALKEAQARLERDQALARKAQDDVRRNTPLAEKDFVSRQAYDQLKSTAEAAQATVKADQASLENLALQLSYCSIRAPISGRTGSLMIQRGNLIKASDENKSLVVIHQILPIYVSFSVPEQYLAQIIRGMSEGKMPVLALISDPTAAKDPIAGTVSFVNNTVDTSTGTIRLKATFPNKDRRLWPGQIANVELTLGIQPRAVVVPSQTIQSGQSGQYAFVVKSEGMVELRPVVVGRSTNGETVIEKGLRPGETVVTDGQLLLAPGTRVSVKGQGNGENGGSGK